MILLIFSGCAALPKTTECYVAGEIPKEYEKFTFGEHEYQYIRSHVNWNIAKQRAEEKGGHLAVFETLEEMLAVIAHREERSTYWVGLTDEVEEGRWMWINGIRLDDEMDGYLERGEDLESRDYAHLLLQGGLMSRHESGGIPKGWRGQTCVSGYIIEWEIIN